MKLNFLISVLSIILMSLGNFSNNFCNEREKFLYSSDMEISFRNLIEYNQISKNLRQIHQEPLSELERGEYLIYQDDSDNTIWAISVNSKEKTFLSDGIGKIGSVNGKYFLTSDSNLESTTLSFTNLFSNEKEVISLNDYCYFAIADSGLEQIAMVCENDNGIPAIQVFRIADNKIINITPFENRFDNYFGVYWSPDGKYIAYGSHGLMLVETDCVEDPETCVNRTSGPYSGPVDETQTSKNSHVWSPNSEYIASVSANGKSVYIFDLELRLYKKAFDVSGGVSALAWSQDGMGLYYTTGEYHSSEPGEIRFHELETGEDSFFYESGLVLFTLTVE